MISAKILYWNNRAIMAHDTSARVLRLIRKCRPLVVCLVKTRANTNRVDCFYAKLPRSCYWAIILPWGFSGGIIVLWNKIVGWVSPISVSRRALHLIISSDSLANWIMLAIYNSTQVWSQCSLWNEFSKLSTLSFPWLIVGDFNSIITNNEHRGGYFRYYSRKSSFFLDFIDTNNLLDLNFSGPRFTWCNNQVGVGPRWALLDHFLTNLE